MVAKVTLSLEKSLIEKGKNYAKSTGKSLSELFENYIKSLATESNEPQISSKLKSIIGVVNLPENFDEKSELENYYKNKHL